MNVKRVLAVCLCCACSAVLCAAESEIPASLQAGDILPSDLLKSDVHTVSEKVELNRFLCKYEVQTPFGIYHVTSTELLKIRVHEFHVLKSARNISGTEEFFGSMKDSVVQVPVAMVDTVFHPISSVEKMGSGVKSKFSAVGRFFTSGREKSEYEDSTFKEASLGKYKRALAAKLGVDVYSSNPNVQKMLNHLARAQSMGAMPVKLAGMAAPAGVGLALTMLSLRRDVSDDLLLKSPSELHAMNNKILRALGISDEVRETFLESKFFSPTHRTLITANLEAMRNVDGLENFLITTLHDRTEEEALFAERQSDMLLFYHKRIDKLKRIGRIGQRLPAAVTQDNVLVVVAPLDYLYIDDQCAETVTTLERIRDDIKAKSVIVALTGFASAGIKAKLHEAGFTIHEHFFSAAGH